jgi:hypothetical protein
MAFPQRSNHLARSRTLFLAAAATVLSLPIASCNRGPAAVRPPAIDPSSAGSQAMEQYDTDGDGVVKGAELDKAPGLKAALPRLDSDNDGGVSADDIAARVEKWQSTEAGLMSFSFLVTLDGSPLADANVTFEPEAFLGDELQAAVGQTNGFGSGGATIPKENRPAPTTPPGMHLGLYKVKISKLVGGKEIVPHKYNEDTVLGQEVAYDVSEIANNRVVYALKTK